VGEGDYGDLHRGKGGLPLMRRDMGGSKKERGQWNQLRGREGAVHGAPGSTKERERTTSKEGKATGSADL